MEERLTEVCRHVHNWFLVKPHGIHRGTFTIDSGTIECEFLKPNQYFRIKGSVFNDGVHKYPAVHLIDEEFIGEIWEMAVPASVISLLDDIEAWETTYGGITGANYSPFQSESFNNYSYSKGTGYASQNSSKAVTPTTWKDVFADRLKPWRKLG